MLYPSKIPITPPQYDSRHFTGLSDDYQKKTRDAFALDTGSISF